MSGTANARTSVMPVFLGAIAAGGTCNRDDIAARAGLTKAQALHAVNNAVNGGYIEPTGEVVDRQQCWRLTALGRVRLAEAPRQSSQVPSNRPARTAAALAEQALALIAKAPGGLDTEQLALKLGARLTQVDAALEPFVAQHRLVTCGLLRGDMAIIQYRSSTGGKGEDWRAHGSLGFHSGMTAQQVQAEQQAARQAEKAAAPAPKAGRAAAPSPAVQAPAPKEPPPEVACEVLDAAPATPPAPKPLPYVGELDIDAAHGKAHVRIEQKAGQTFDKKADQAAPDRFMCALYSNGALLIDSNNELVTLPVEHTRQLLHYLEHLGATALLGVAS